MSDKGNEIPRENLERFARNVKTLASGKLKQGLVVPTAARLAGIKPEEVEVKEEVRVEGVPAWLTHGMSDEQIEELKIKVKKSEEVSPVQVHESKKEISTEIPGVPSWLTEGMNEKQLQEVRDKMPKDLSSEDTPQ